MTPHHPLGIGVVGTGGWAREFWKDAKDCPDVRLVACWNRTRERAERFAERFGCTAMPSLEELLRHPEVEAVANFAVNTFHREPTEAAAALGKHVFVDKPIANSVADSRAMIRACEQAGVTLMIGHSRRYGGIARTLKRLLEEGELGELVMAEGNNSHSGGTRLDPGKWRWHRAEAPGGPLMQLAIHIFDTMHYLLGPTRRVTALSTASLLPSEIEDVFLTLLEFESGLLAYVGTNYLSPSASFLRIYGRGGSAYAEESKVSVARVKPDEPWITETDEVAVESVSASAAEMAELARAVRTGTPPETGGKEGLLALGVVWASIMSAAQGRPVEVAEALAEDSSTLD